MVKVVVVGMPGSGKDILIRAAKELGFSHIRMGDMVRAFAKERGLDSGDENIGGFATEQRQECGDDIWAKRTLERMPLGDVVIDGSRSLAEIECFKGAFGKELVIVSVRASAENRFQRLKQRERDDDPETREEFEVRDRREESWGILKALESAEIVVGNDGELEDFRQRCHDILQDIKKLHGKSI